MTILKRILAALSIIILIMVIYFLWVRTYQLHWGATNQELNEAMPGDHLDSALEFFSTRAMTISGTPEEIWP